MCSISFKGCIPIQLSGFHICHAPSIFKVIFPFLKLLLDPVLRTRLQLHYGTDQAVVNVLKQYDIVPEQIHVDMGGKWDYDHAAWIEKRRALGM